MATVAKTWDFTADAMGLADSGSDANLAFAWDATDRAVKFTCTAKSVTATELARRATTGETWETWGVPAGATVTGLQVTGWAKKLVSNTKLSSHTLVVSVVDPAGALVHAAAGDLLSTTLPTTVDVGYVAQAAGPVVAVDAAYQASNTDVRLGLSYSVTTSGGGGSASVDQRFDAITLEIAYTPPGGGAAAAVPVLLAAYRRRRVG
jgi:hypothetical protein